MVLCGVSICFVCSVEDGSWMGGVTWRVARTSTQVLFTMKCNSGTTCVGIFRFIMLMP
jgi:hypothetical protein